MSVSLALFLPIAIPTTARAQTPVMDSAGAAFDRSNWAEASRLYTRALVASPTSALQVRMAPGAHCGADR